MKINGKHDVDVPLAFVAQVLVDFPGWERAAMRRGIDVRRTDRQTGAVQGASWTARFPFRRKMRNVDLTIVEHHPSGRLVVSFMGASTQGTAIILPLAMGPRRTRITTTLDVQARTLAARLLFQSLRFARQRMVIKFEARLAMLGAEIETRYAALG
jgi:carbon monoxide dehydrogenase subunit G